MDIRELSQSERESPEFGRLLWLSAEVDELSLSRIRVDHLSRLTVAGAVVDEVVVGFVAYDSGVSPLIVEYIATAESWRGTGLGTTLIRDVQRRHPGVAIFAQTDDDAIGFYRRIGFTDTPAPRDPRWPDRQRYDCVLQATRWPASIA